MKREKIRFFGFFMAILFSVLSITACGQTPGLDVEQFWSKQDVFNAEDLVNSMGGLIVTREVTLNMKPPFYNGTMPLHYKTTAKEMGGGMMSSLSTPAIYNFGTWSNQFIYKDEKSLIYGMPDGAVAVSNTDNTLIAECKVMKLLSDSDKQLTGFEIAEIHYSQDGRRAIFTSTFVVDFPIGFKSREKETRGKKEKEYFFIWPGGLGGF